MKIYVVTGEIGYICDGDYEWWLVAATSSEEHADQLIEDIQEEEEYCIAAAQEVDEAGYFCHLVPHNLFNPNGPDRLAGIDPPDVRYSWQEIELTDIKMALLKD